MPLRFSTGLVDHNATTGSLLAGISGCYLMLYTGAQPATADDAATGTLLATLTGGAVADIPLTFENGDGDGDIKKTAAQAWEGDGVAAGTAGWFRLHLESTNQAGTEAAALTVSTTLRRVDGTIAASGAQLNMSNTTVAIGAPQRVSTFSLQLPKSA